MQSATAPRHRTRRAVFANIWNVDIQTIPGMWHTVGTVRSCLPDDGRAWEAIHRGVSLSIFPTKREAVQAVIQAEASL